MKYNALVFVTLFVLEILENPTYFAVIWVNLKNTRIVKLHYSVCNFTTVAFKNKEKIFK